MVAPSFVTVTSWPLPMLCRILSCGGYTSSRKQQGFSTQAPSHAGFLGMEMPSAPQSKPGTDDRVLLVDHKQRDQHFTAPCKPMHDACWLFHSKPLHLQK